MPLQSDISINRAKFDPRAVTEKTSKFNEYLIGMGKSGPTWWEVGASKYRQMRMNGETALPKPTILSQGRDINIPSRNPTRSIPCRLFFPSSSKSNGVVMHIHGGGWVLMSEKSFDPMLRFYADATGCAVISVGYRLAPEDPFPAGVEDCFDVAEYLITNGEKEYGGELLFMGGESAGAHLSVLTTFYLLRKHSSLTPPSLLLHFGAYDLSFLPQLINFHRPLILDMTIMKHFVDAFLPGMSIEQKRDPRISPFYEDLEPFRGRLPTALFTCGTADCLLDDTVMMSTKWSMAGGEAIVKIYEGGCHGFIAFSPEMSEEAGKAIKDTEIFIQDCLEKKVG